MPGSIDVRRCDHLTVEPTEGSPSRSTKSVGREGDLCPICSHLLDQAETGGTTRCYVRRTNTQPRQTKENDMSTTTTTPPPAVDGPVPRGELEPAVRLPATPSPSTTPDTSTTSTTTVEATSSDSTELLPSTGFESTLLVIAALLVWLGSICRRIAS